MTTTSDAQLLLDHLDRQGITGADAVTRGWDHMGALLTDAALQSGRRYKTQVLPRVRNLIAAWPDANTTTGLLRRLDTDDIGATLPWNGPRRLAKIPAMATVLQQHKIETVPELASALAGPERDVLRAELGALWGVGPKTLNYLSILAGDAHVVAIDVQVRAVARAAGITDVTTSHLETVLHEAAAIRGWRAGDLDAAIWDSTQRSQSTSVQHR